MGARVSKKKRRAPTINETTMGAGVSKKKSRSPEIDETTAILVSETPFAVNEVESARELYRKLSSSIVDDGLIQKEELQFALFRTTDSRNLFVDRGTDHIDFEEFVRALSIFHPKTPEAEKVAYAFKLYDLRRTGFIEREELKLMVLALALLNESDLSLTDDMVENIVERTFKEVDTDGDGKINQEEQKDYASKNPLLLRNMTLPYLMDITLRFPSFVMRTEGEITT